MYNRAEQENIFVDYFKEGEKEEKDFKIGMEIEHLLVREDNLKAISYQDDDGGITEILYELFENGPWEGIWEGKNLLGLRKPYASISLEPGGQLELSVEPCRSLKRIEEIYHSFLKEIKPLLTSRNLLLLTLGYQPESSIDDISLLPKKRYRFMYSYFKNQGRYAHHMMKGTASLQVNLDYSSEKDFSRKMQIAYYLTPYIYYLFDNAPFFEGEAAYKNSIREKIWKDCDKDRCGLIPGIRNQYFGYRDYASFLLDIPAIMIKKKGNLVYTGSKKIKDLMAPGDISREEIVHFISMVFTDVRLKNYLEIRVGDSLPPVYSLAYLALWKGLFYSQENLDYLYREMKTEQKDDLPGSKDDIFKFGSELINKAKQGLSSEERNYLNPLADLFLKKQRPKEITLSQLNKGKINALNWCVLP